MEGQERGVFCGLLAACILVLGAPPARGTESEVKLLRKDRTLSPYFHVMGADPSREQFPLKDTSVTVDIDGVIAEVHVSQTYANTGQDPIHATYVFPASTRAAVHGMQMTIGERTVVARIRKRRAARKEFDRARKAGKSASLLQQHRPNVFSMDVANILGGDTVKIDLRYTEIIVPTDGVYEFVYPTVVGPRYSNQPESKAPEEDRWIKTPYLRKSERPRESEKPGRTFHITTRVECPVPIQDLRCSSHKIAARWTSKNRVAVELAPEEGIAGNRDYILDYRLAGKDIVTGCTLCRAEEENTFLFMAQPPRRVKARDLPPREYIFVVDVSGSMHGFPLDVSKKLLEDLLGNLLPKDTFNVVLFAGGSSVLAPASLPATEAHVDDARNLIARQRGGGGTELSAAMQAALDLPRTEGVSRTILLATDGYVGNEKETFQIVRKNIDRTNVFVFGIGTSVNRHLLEGVARAGQGEPFIVTRPQEAAPVAARFRKYVESPVLTSVSVEFDGFDAYDVEPVRLPDMFAERPVVVFGKWRGRPAGTIRLRGVTGEGKYEQSVRLEGVEPQEGGEALRYLWARTRIARLSDCAFEGTEEDRIEEVTSLGLRYNLLTQHTSFVAVLDVKRNKNGAARSVKQPLPLPKGVSELAVGCRSLFKTPEPGLPVLLALIALAAAALHFLRRKLRGA